MQKNAKTMQQCTGFKELVRGFMVKDQKGANFKSTMYTTVNKILVKRPYYLIINARYIKMNSAVIKTK